jgi:hypothetical protein
LLVLVRRGTSQTALTDLSVSNEAPGWYGLATRTVVREAILYGGKDRKNSFSKGATPLFKGDRAAGHSPLTSTIRCLNRSLTTNKVVVAPVSSAGGVVSGATVRALCCIGAARSTVAFLKP